MTIGFRVMSVMTASIRLREMQKLQEILYNNLLYIVKQKTQKHINFYIVNLSVGKILPIRKITN